MCGIAGIFNFMGNDVSRQLKHMLQCLLHRGPDGSGVIIDDKVAYGQLDKIIFPSGSIGIGHNRLRIIGEGLQPIPNENEDLWLVHNGEIYNYLELRAILNKHVFRTNMNSETILHAFEEKKLDLLDGNYAFAIYDRSNERIEIYRDAVGIRPLFYCLKNDLFAFASERKALKQVCDITKRLNPGYRIIVEHDGVSEEKFDDIESTGILPIRKLEEAENNLRRALERAVEKRICEPIGILFSGGIDSSIIAKIGSYYTRDMILLVAGLVNSPDIKRAREAAEKLGIELQEAIITEEEAIELFYKVVKIVDEPNPLKALIGIPVYVATKKAKELGLWVILSGQGADELFGGYAKYLRVSNLEEALINDLRNIHQTNLERDDHCAMMNSVEIRVPYLDREVIRVALSIPTEYKIKNGVRKWILRRVGRLIGLPKDIISYEKKAIQYGSGVVRVLKRYSKRKKKSLKELAHEAFLLENNSE